MLINCGIHSIWHAESYPDEMADAMLKEAGVQVGTLPLERDEHIDISDEVSPGGGHIGLHGYFWRKVMSESRFAPFMKEALACAERGRWHTAPNPLWERYWVRDGRIVARGWHAAYGEAHAEIACLADAARNGVDPSECSLVVTLEPCNHYGKTPPCVEAVLAAGIRHVVVGMRDINPEARGGIETLLAAGVSVETGVLER